MRRPKLSNLLADNLRQRIARDRLKPGDRLPNERTLVEYYECSKGTMREALRVLEVTGLVNMQTGPNGGAEILEVSVEAPTRKLRTSLHYKDLDFPHFYEVRRIYEVVLDQSGIGKVTAAYIAQRKEKGNSYT